MPLRAILWLVVFTVLTEAVVIRSTSRCAPNEYWCQDRCGSDDYGNTCCETPDGQHNLCGADTICSPTTLTTGGETFTLTPPSSVSTTTTTSSPVATTWTRSDGETVISSSGVVIIGTSRPITLPTVSSPTTLTTGGETFTLTPPQSVTTTPPSTTTTSSTDIGPITTFSEWPSGAVITPVTTEVDEPEETDGGAVVPCDLWFFFVCISTPEINIGGWFWRLPPGVYPPGPPPPGVINLPTGINIQGSLPPWPRITVGPDHKPTYSSRPDECETESATLCATTSSVGASTTNVASTCTNIVGCAVTDSDTTRTTTSSCSTATVTDFFVSCTTTAPGSSSCTTTSSLVESGCSVTGTVSTTFGSGSCVLRTTRTTTIEELDPPTSTTSSIASTTSSSTTSSTSSSTPASITATATTFSTFDSTDFPTLSTAWTTPEGSTCASTTTYTSCIFPGGGNSACAVSTTCASWAATSTSTTSTGPTETPLAINTKGCYYASELFPNEDPPDIDEDFQQQYIPWACATDDTAAVDVVLGPDSEPMTFDTRTNGVPYWYSVSWIEDCETSVSEQYAYVPIPGGEDTCYSLMRGNFENCEKDGGYVGGYVDAGCLRYVFEPCDPDEKSCHR
ncbi:uncharacterized protein B0H64DRAFT_455416 [Chaetomium fimeti]|uniref:Uncharacterized protein n=1 Tax=Chaetomium fimeti TaxID=1854472 RepID=A0AAE0HPJ6_9PEZI|nr:hypothetical protein B0H64DRAFT_455416 [Chaetomium fimeti]